MGVDEGGLAVVEAGAVAATTAVAAAVTYTAAQLGVALARAARVTVICTAVRVRKSNY